MREKSEGDGMGTWCSAFVGIVIGEAFCSGLGVCVLDFDVTAVFRCDSGGLEIDERGFWRFELDGLLEIFPVLILH